jgi:predicted transcriptional regulator
MFNKVKQKIGEQIDEFQQKREEQKRLEKEAADAKVRADREHIRLEKEALRALSDKALMVETVMALRTLNSRLDTLETQQADLKTQIQSLQWDVDMLPREEK